MVCLLLSSVELISGLRPPKQQTEPPREEHSPLSAAKIVRLILLCYRLPFPLVGTEPEMCTFKREEWHRQQIQREQSGRWDNGGLFSEGAPVLSDTMEVKLKVQWRSSGLARSVYVKKKYSPHTHQLPHVPLLINTQRFHPPRIFVRSFHQKCTTPYL